MHVNNLLLLSLLQLTLDMLSSVAANQVRHADLTQPQPPCGKICSYEWDAKEEGKYYPLLYKIISCPNTLLRMAHSPYAVVLPPPRSPPPDLLTKFTIDGQCPVVYVHNMYIDESPTGNRSTRMHYTAKNFRKYLERDRRTNINTYKDNNVLKPALRKYAHMIRDKHVAVIGTLFPWAEAMLLNLGARLVTTVEYREVIIDDERVQTTTPYRLAEQFINEQSVVPFDTVFTYSSLEHSGLGRYGDPLSPFGDLEATAQIWCMVKKGGHFILGVPVSEDRENCSIIWNAHRVYGSARLQHLTANWCVG